MTSTNTVELQRLMNACQEDRGGAKKATINGQEVRCIGVHMSNTSKLSFRFDLNGKRAPFAKVCSALEVTA